MKNVYSLGATTTQKDKFKLDIQYQSDSAGVYVSYIPEAKYKNTKLLRVMNLDRLDANNRPNPNGQFDYVEGYTIRTHLLPRDRTFRKPPAPIPE
jgi:cell surface protein SprA